METKMNTEAAPVQSGRHTPGPWHIVEVDGAQKIQVKSRKDGRGVIIAIHDGSEEGQANARLIAAAPALLAAVEDLLPLHEEYQAKLESPSFTGSRNFIAENRTKIQGIRAILAAVKGGDK